MADLNSLLAELGGDSPQNRAIAEGLQKQGINSTKDIQVQKVNVPGYSFGSDESAGYVPDTTRNVYFNKATGQEINPTRLGIIQNGTAGIKDGDIFFHLNADDQGNISFEPEWSPRAHGFLRDNPIGQLIMKAGAIIPNPFQPAFVAANVGDALAHEKYGKALLAALPYGAQELGITDALKGYANDFLGLGPDVSNPSIVGQTGLPSGLPDSMDAVTSPVSGSGVLQSGVFDGSPLDVSVADQTLQKIINPLDTGVPIDSMTARGIADSFYNPNGQLTNAAGQSGNLTLDDIIAGKGTSIQDIVGSDFSGGTPTDGMLGNAPADVVNGNKLILQNGSLTDPSALTTANTVDTSGGNAVNGGGSNLTGDGNLTKLVNNGTDASGNSLVDLTGSKVDLNGNPVSDTLTLSKALDLGSAYLNNPAALAGLVGTGLAATGLVNNVINPVKTTDTTGTNTGATTTSQIASMVPAGSTHGLQDLFDYANLYKNSPFLNKQQTTQQQAQQQVQQQTPSFTVSDVFRSLMADAAPQPKIEPNLVGLADLQKKMMVK